MKIVILDGHTVNPGDQDWKPLEKFGEVVCYPTTVPDQTLERCRGAEILITSKVILDKKLIEQLPKVKYIGVIATGYNVVDLQYTKDCKIIVTNIPDYCTGSVAQTVFAHMLAMARRVAEHDQSVKAGDWVRSEYFSYWVTPQIELNDKVLGLIGCGHIGKAVAKIGHAMGMKVVAYDPYLKKTKTIELVDLETVFTTSDFISLHCPLNETTRHIIRSENLQKMKKSAYLINTGRGPLVDLHDLTEALNNDVIAGAGLDVLEVEPPPADSPIFKAKNCIITPHIAWASYEARKRLIQYTADNLEAFLDGKPINVVNK